MQRACSAEQFFTHLGLTRSIYPGIDWHANPFLGFVATEAGSQRVATARKRRLPCSRSIYAWAAETKREKVLIQQRDTDFETLAHARQINFKEKIIRENETDIHFRGLR